MEKTIILHTREIKKEKQVFYASSAEINGIWYRIKFTKEVPNSPRARGLYDLTIDIDNCSLEKGQIYTDNDGNERRENDIIWVNKIENIVKYDDEKLKEQNREKFKGVFGE